MKTIITHSGDFHADDVFAVAVLSVLFPDAEVVRTRDEDIIKTGDYVVDVGGVYDPEQNRYDHHQEGGAGERENGIPYAAFGLVWKHFGEKVTGSKETALQIDSHFVQTIDALDNGVEISQPIFPDVYPFSMNALVSAFRPTWKEDSSKEELDRIFNELVEAAVTYIKRIITISGSYLEAKERVLDTYNKSENKKIIILDKGYPFQEVLSEFPEPLFVVSPRKDGSWGVKTIKVDSRTFKNRKDLPLTWAGKKDEELAKITGVHDAVFCHNKRFLAVSKSQEGAIKLAEKAVGV